MCRSRKQRDRRSKKQVPHGHVSGSSGDDSAMALGNM
jgi:hypothetical protein